MPSDFIQRLINLERICAPLPRRVESVLARSGKTEQDLRFARRGGGTCVTTFSGFIFGCLGDALPGGTIRFVGSTTGLDYGTFEADGSGEYEAELKIEETDSLLDVYTGGPEGRFDEATAQDTDVAFSRCGTNSSLNYDTLAGSGYTCADVGGDRPCNVPIGTTLDCTDPYGNTSVAFDGTDTWVGCQAVAYPGGVLSCGASSTAYEYQLIWNGTAFQLVIRFPASGFPPSPCPTSGTCPPSGVTPTLSIGQAFTWTCPNPATSTKFSVSFTAPSGNLLYPSGGTITFEEP